MKIKYVLLTLVLAIGFSTLGMAQKRKKKKAKKPTIEGLTVGGYLGFGLANQQFGFELSPSVGYEIIDERLIVGTGLKWEKQYSYFNNQTDDRRIIQALGPKVYAQARVLGAYYAHVEYQYQTITGKDKYADGTEADLGKAIDHPVFLGGGYNTQFGEGLGFAVEILYHVNYEGTQAFDFLNRINYRIGVMYTF